MIRSRDSGESQPRFAAAIDLLTGRVWLVQTFKTATSEEAARNFVGSLFRDVGLPDVLVQDSDTRFTSAFWTCLHVALGASLVYGSQHHHSTTSKVERVNKRHRRRLALLCRRAC